MILAILACGFGGLGITFWILLRRGSFEKRHVTYVVYFGVSTHTNF